MNPLLVIDHLADILTLEEIEIIRKPQSTSQERIGVLIGILYEKNEKYRPFERFIKALEETDENHKRMAKSIMNIYVCLLFARSKC
uniref:CARD domain-containing protein n=1 Tax=Plectus sambesii TaxID=2011161 RepID=A0A914XSN1_9BILA